MIHTLAPVPGRPLRPDFAVVTATTRLTPLSTSCVASWMAHATYGWPVYTLVGTYGVVPAFAEAVAHALAAGAQVVAAFHDDLRIDEPGWDARVLEHFDAHPRCGLAGFGGALGLGAADIYQTPYSPYQLARQGFLSNMQDAEAHGTRTTRTQRAVCFDGMCQIGRDDFWNAAGDQGRYGTDALHAILERGAVHHAYDSWLGAMAARLHWEAWLIPVACHHFGGQTAVLDPGYHAWAADKGGDAGIWEAAHRAMYDDCRGLLPLRVGA